MAKKKSKLAMPPSEAKKQTTRTPDGEEYHKMTHAEVNLNNLIPVTLRMWSNMNKNMTECARELKEIKELLRAKSN